MTKSDQREIYTKLVRDAASFYSPEQPYHNAIHAANVVHAVEPLIQLLKGQGYSHINSNALYVAAAWHDAGYHEDHEAKGYQTKEHYSAALASTAIEQSGIADPKPFKAQVRNLIIATTSGVDRRTPGEVAIHHADVSNIFGPFDPFWNTVRALFEEEKAKGSDASFEDWAQTVESVVGREQQTMMDEFGRLGISSTWIDLRVRAANRNKQELRNSVQVSTRRRTL